MNNYFIVPGLGNSGPEHWQTFLENSGSNFKRIEQQEWDAPECSDWIDCIEQALTGYDLTTVILIGHSLGCAAIVHWAARYGKLIKGAMLVAPSDIEGAQYTFPAKGFAPLPMGRMPFNTLMIVSSNDPWVSLERAKYFADNWGSSLVNIGQAGHINVASGHHRWEEGLVFLQSLG